MNGAAHTESPGSQADRAALFETLLGSSCQSEASAQLPDERDADAHEQGEQEQDNIPGHIHCNLIQSVSTGCKRVPIRNNQTVSI